MKIALKKIPGTDGHVEVVSVDGDPAKVPSDLPYESEEAAIQATAQYLGQLSSQFDEVVYEG